MTQYYEFVIIIMAVMLVFFVLPMTSRFIAKKVVLYTPFIIKNKRARRIYRKLS